LAAIQETLAPLQNSLTRVEARPASREELSGAHAVAYLDRTARAFESKRGYLDPDTFFNEHTGEAALLAAGGTAHLAEQVARGALSAAASFVRPPGHHATRDTAMGFCVYNNVAVAARSLKAQGLAEKILIIDWDVHHGNGTEDIFWDDPSVLFLSYHQHPLYPGTGRLSDSGGDKARGKTINLPLPPGSTDADYLHAWDQVVVPAAESFQPDFVFVSAGYDAYEHDPLGSMRVTEEGFQELAARALRLPGASRLAAVLEGGYNTGALGRIAASLLKTMQEKPAPRPNPGPPSAAVAQIVSHARELHGPYWKKS
jgi:acetoin utilization deacetylase AcuC-like enzyme